MTGTAVVRAAALERNAGFPGVETDVAAGLPMVRVVARFLGYGKTMRVVVNYGVETVDGGWVEAANPQAFTVRVRDRRLSASENARRRFAPELARSGLAVRWMEGQEVS